MKFCYSPSVCCENIFVLPFLKEFSSLFALQLVAGVMDPHVWSIRSVDAIDAAISLLPFTKPAKKIEIELQKFTPTQALGQLAATIKHTRYDGKLDMWLYHSRKNFIPCDEFMKELHGAK